MKTQICMKASNAVDRVYTWLKHGCYQRSLHYHNTPLSRRNFYDKQLEYVKEHYEVWTPKDALAYLKTGIRGEKPSVMIGAFDGYRNNYEVLFPLLEEKGMHGWFLLVTDFINTPAAEQEQVLTPYRMQWVPDEYPDNRYAMNWEEAARIGVNHTIVNHTSTHYLLSGRRKEEELQYEIRHADEMIKEKTGVKPEVFSWLGGGWMEKNARAAEILRENDYHFLLGYRLEYFDETDSAGEIWEKAVPAHMGRQELDREIRHYEQVVSNIGWYRAVPAILPFYQKGYLITDGKREEDVAIAGHFAAIAEYLIRERSMGEEAAVNTALEVISFGEYRGDAK